MQGYFTWWVVLSLIWAVVASVLATFLPILEAWRVVFQVFANIFPCIPGLSRFRQSSSPTPSEASEIERANKIQVPIEAPAAQKA